VKEYIYSVIRAMSRLINAISGGYSGEAVSGRAWRTDTRWMIRVLDCIWFMLGDGRYHCYRSYLLDKNCVDKPKERRNYEFETR